MASNWKRKEAEGTPQKTITDADYADDIAILQIHLTKPKHYCIVWNEQQQA